VKSDPGFIANDHNAEIIPRVRCVDEFSESLPRFLEIRGQFVLASRISSSDMGSSTLESHFTT
jgi:hypothetical protein